MGGKRCLGHSAQQHVLNLVRCRRPGHMHHYPWAKEAPKNLRRDIRCSSRGVVVPSNLLRHFKESYTLSNAVFLLERFRVRRWIHVIKPRDQLGFLNLRTHCQNNKTGASCNLDSLKQCFRYQG